MAKQQPSLTAQQRQECASRLPEAIRAALMGISLTGFDVCREGVHPEELCHPLTKEQLTRLHTCTGFTRRDMEVVHVPGDGEALLFRVCYDMSGYDADGNPVIIRGEGALGVHCACRGGGEFREVIAITDAFPCWLQEDGSVKQPGWLVRRMRRWLRKRERVSAGETAGEILLEVLGAVLELALEALFDG